MNFRFHIVSIVAIFLALALGIGMGVTVIDKATVDFLRKRIDTVSAQVSTANRKSDQLNTQIGRDGNYENRAEDYLVDKQLTNVPIIIIASRGIDEGPLGDLKKVLAKSGALTQGTLWFTAKNALTDSRDASQLQLLLGASSVEPNVLRQALVTRVSAALAGTNDGTVLKPLVDNGFLDWQGDAGGGDVSKLSFAASRIVVNSAYNPTVSNDQLALPLTRLLASQPVHRVVAVEAGRDADDKNSAQRAIFLSSLRADAALSGKLSTVDDLETSSGRVAAVLALNQVVVGRTGNYGVASSAEGPIPKLNP